MKVFIVDYGSQYTFSLARRLRSLEGGGVLCEIISPEQLGSVNGMNCSGVVLSGGPQSVSENGATADERRVIEDPAIPVFGVCYGMQLIGHVLGGQVHAAAQGEFGPMSIHVLDPTDPIFAGVRVDKVWMSHGDEVVATDELRKKATVVALSAGGMMAALGCARHNCYGVQFHPEVQHTDNGSQLIKNFITGPCKLPPNTWTAKEQLQTCYQSIREAVGQNDRVVLGLSGGVDSAVVAGLLSASLPADQWLAVYVDHGMMRAGETEAIKAYAESRDMPFQCIDHSEEFLEALKDVIDPEEKRKIIGRLFVEAFTKAAKEFRPTMLAQGTIYPDVIESAKSTISADGKSKAHLIKSHHNVGGLPAKLGLRLLEPLRLLFKDEVRAIGAQLGLPVSIIQRPPFPGPGLGIRIIGQTVTRQRVGIVQRADAIFHRFIRAQPGLVAPPSQSYAALLSDLVVGVVGDQRRHGALICLRAVRSDDFMTASVFDFSMEFLQAVAAAIVNECPDVACVVYNVTPKPPGTIELE